MGRALNFIKDKTALLAAITLAAIVGGATTALVMAAIPDGKGVIHGCIRPANDNLRIIDTEAGQTCTAGQTPISWDQSSGAKVYKNIVNIAQGATPVPLLTVPNIGEFVVTSCEYDASSASVTFTITYTNTTSSTVDAGDNVSVAPGAGLDISQPGDQMSMISNSTQIAGIWNWGGHNITSEIGGSCTARILVTLSN